MIVVLVVKAWPESSNEADIRLQKFFIWNKKNYKIKFF